MKVKHLIRELEKCDQESTVITESCCGGCVGDTYFIDIDDEGEVLLNRSYSPKRDDEYDNAEDTPYPLLTGGK